MGSNLSADSVFLSNPGMMTPPSLAAYLSLLLLPGKKSTESWARPCSDLLPWVQHRHGASTVLHGAKSNRTEQLLRSAKTHSQSEEARCQPQVPEHVLTPPESVLLSLKGHHQQATLNNMGLNFTSNVDFFRQVQDCRTVFSSLRYFFSLRYS